MNGLRPRLTAAAAVLAGVAGGAVSAAEVTAGVARADITPSGPIRLSGFGHRDHPSEGVEAPLGLRALALRSGQDPPLILITADLIGFTPEIADDIAARIETSTGVPRERVMLAASHTHAGPVIEGNLEVMFGLEGAEAEAVRAYAASLRDKAAAAAEAAVRDLQPACLTLRRGRATIGCNRRAWDERGVHLGVNPLGPADPDVPVLRIDDPGGRLRAVVFGYAAHCTAHGDYRICGDWAGYAQSFLEQAHPGSTALFVAGCGANVCPRPERGIDIARAHGLELAGAVTAALREPGPDRRTEIAGPLRALLARVDLPLTPAPSREELEARVAQETARETDADPETHPDIYRRRHARRLLDRLARDGKLPSAQSCPVQVWALGDGLTWVALGGEVVVEYALRLKQEFGEDRLWVSAYANDVFGYVPTALILREGGYEADYNLIYYGVSSLFAPDVEKTLLGAVRELMKKVRMSTPASR